MGAGPACWDGMGEVGRTRAAFPRDETTSRRVGWDGMGWDGRHVGMCRKLDPWSGAEAGLVVT